jgi:hypothetical protein
MTPRATVPFHLAALVSSVLLVVPGVALGHSPDPTVGGALWAQDQLVRYDWRSGQVPPLVMQAAINGAAAGSNASRASRAAVFDFDPAGTSLIAYGEPTPCGVNGIACFNRGGAPVSFGIWFRRHGHVFDWGALRWCQLYDAPPDGCYDAENITLDELGHVQVLGHHQNFADNSDYLDAVVQTLSRTKPRAGWNAHAYGRCDRATLQRTYDMRAWTAGYSTCLDLNTTLSMAVSARAVPYRGSATFTATLRVGTSTAYGRLSGNPASGRAVTLQRRVPGGTWATIDTMSQGAAAGTYAETFGLTTTYEWRAVFRTPTGEGLNGSTSPGITLTVGPCTLSCPLSGGTSSGE